jgi:hypothetical protein
MEPAKKYGALPNLGSEPTPTEYGGGLPMLEPDATAANKHALPIPLPAYATDDESGPFPIDLINGEIIRRILIKKGYLPENILPKAKQLTPWDIIELQLKLQNPDTYKLNPPEEGL